MTDKQDGFLLNRRQTLLMLGATGLTTIAVPGFFRGEALAKEAPKGQIIIGFSQEPTVFNPHLLHVECDEGVHYAVFDPLFDVDPEGNYFPLLAAEVPTVANGGISADGLNWKIKLRDDVKWHDGKPFTAEDVKFTLELLTDPDFRSWRRTGHELVRDLTVVSPTELTWRMEKPFAPYAAFLASTFIVPKHAFDGVVDKNSAPFNNAPIGTGAFKWKKRVAGDHIELEANPDYFGEGPHIQQVVIKYIPDLTVLYTQFKTGDVDLVGVQWITADHYEEAKSLPGRIIELTGVATIESISLNMERPYFKDPAVREALYHALDKQAIIDAIYYGVPTPTESYMPKESYYYNPDLPKHEYNIDKAKAILDKAGWKPGADGIREKDGVRLSFKNSTTAGNNLREQAQQFVQQSFRDIGVEMTISNLPPAVMWGDYWMMSQFDSVMVGLTPLIGPDPDPSDFFKSTASPAKGGTGQNTWVYANAEVDALMEQGGALFVPEERLPIYKKVQELVRKDLPMLPMFQYMQVRGRKADVDGFKGNINNRIDTWNIRDWRRK